MDAVSAGSPHRSSVGSFSDAGTAAPPPESSDVLVAVSGSAKPEDAAAIAISELPARMASLSTSASKGLHLAFDNISLGAADDDDDDDGGGRRRQQHSAAVMAALPTLVHKQHLRVLSLQLCDVPTALLLNLFDGHMSSGSRVLKGLREVCFDRCTGLTAQVVAAALKATKDTLQALCVHDAEVGDDAFTASLGSCSHLRKLELHGKGTGMLPPAQALTVAALLPLLLLPSAGCPITSKTAQHIKSLNRLQVLSLKCTSCCPTSSASQRSPLSPHTVRPLFRRLYTA